MKKRSIICLLLLLTVCVSTAVLLFAGCGGSQGEVPGPPVTQPIDPEIIETPVAGNIVVGQTTHDSVLTGKFEAEGVLRFSEEAIIAERAGVLDCAWEFLPADTKKYNRLTGIVKVNVYRCKIVFEENGGFEVEDVYFNDSYTLTEQPLTAKNEFRFDGWSEAQASTAYLAYPKRFTQSTTLYAGYRFHSADKIYYFKDEEFVDLKPTGRYYYRAIADWSQYWAIHDPNGNHEPYHGPSASLSDPPFEDSVEGEVIIADMYDGLFVEEISSFDYTKITNVVFGNFIKKINGDTFTRTLLEEITIPETVTQIDTYAFDRCSELKKVVFEAGEGEIEMGSSGIFGYCGKLTDVTLNRVKKLTGFSFSGLQEITIPKEVTEIGLEGFYACTNLQRVTFEEGSLLQEVGQRAFGSCLELTEIDLPATAKVAPTTFFNDPKLARIGITDEQIRGIAEDLHTAYICASGTFTTEITRDAQYGGNNFKGQYIANSEKIELKFEVFSIRVLDALIHEFFHHYQYVLTDGVGGETFDTVPVSVTKYHIWTTTTNRKPFIIVKKDDYERATEQAEAYRNGYILIDEAVLAQWRQPYIDAEEDYEAYWNQPVEVYAREFAYLFTAVNYS